MLFPSASVWRAALPHVTLEPAKKLQEKQRRGTFFSSRPTTIGQSTQNRRRWGKQKEKKTKVVRRHRRGSGEERPGLMVSQSSFSSIPDGSANVSEGSLE